MSQSMDQGPAPSKPAVKQTNNTDSKGGSKR